MDRVGLERLQYSKLRTGLERVLDSNRFYSAKFAAAGISLAHIDSLANLVRIPFTTKSEVFLDQQSNPPYGTNLSSPLTDYVRMHQSSGTTTGQPLRWLDDAPSWSWVLDCWQQIYSAAGLTRSDRLFFAFSFGPFLGFWAAFDGANRFGCFTLAGGGASTVARLRMILDNNITFVLCTPTYAIRLAEAARENGINLPSSAVRGLILAGEPGGSIPATRKIIEAGWGARVFDHNGMTEIGSLGAEFVDYPGKLFLLEDQAICEFVDPNTGRPVAEGEPGELVLTNLGRWGAPLIRYRTGDLVRWRGDVHPAGFPFRYLEGGILGRIDDMLWIKGNNVYPTAIENIIREFAEIDEFQLEVKSTDAGSTLTIAIEVSAAPEAKLLARKLQETIQNRHSFRPEIRLAEKGSLPRSEMKSRRVVRI